MLIDEKAIQELISTWKWYIEVEKAQSKSDGTDSKSQEYLKGRLSAWQQAVEELEELL